MRFVSVSDLHGDFVKIPDGDVLICAGDMTTGHIRNLEYVADCIHRLPHKHKILIAGNHDICISQERVEALNILRDCGIMYLEDSDTTLHGIHIYGSPWTRVYGLYPFMLPKDKRKEKWKLIPDRIDILVTHGPPSHILDRNREGEHIGDYWLRTRIEQVRPDIHIFGHCHEGYGMKDDRGITYLNVSTHMDVLAGILRPPIVFDYDKLTGEITVI
jgi:Icc-related predicted phosphoesterase